MIPGASDPEALDRALGRVATAAYTLLVLAMLVGFVPGLRQRCLEWARQLVYRYELGRWEERFEHLEPHVQEALEVRGRRHVPQSRMRGAKV